MIEQTKTKPQETLEFEMNKQMQTFSFNPSINLAEEGKWLLAVSSFECTNSVLNITNENNSFSVTIPGHWKSESAEETINELNKLLELRSQNDIDLHVEQVRKKGLILINDYSLSSLDDFREEILEELKNAKYNDLEDLVYRFQLTYDEIIDVLDLKYISTKRIGHSSNPGSYEVIDLNNTLNYILPDNAKVSFTIDDIRLKSILKNIQTLLFTNKSFFYTILVFTQSYQGLLNDIEGFYQLLPGSYKGDRPIKITEIDKIHFKCDCIIGSIVNGVRESVLYSSALSCPPGHKIYKKPRIKLFKKINKSVLFHITFYLEDDDHKPVIFSSEIVSFTCQLIKI